MEAGLPWCAEKAHHCRDTTVTDLTCARDTDGTLLTEILTTDLTAGLFLC